MALNKRLNSDTPEKDLPPIFGLKSIRLSSLEEATQGLESEILGLDEQVQWAKEKCKYPSPHGLTLDESAAIFLYTMEGTEKNLYDVLNKALRQRQRSVLHPWLLYLRLLVAALQKCPTISGNIWRGVKDDQQKLFTMNEIFQWWAVTSCSTRLSVVKNFLPKNGTLFLIENINGRDISLYSVLPNEQEIVLLPGSKLHVKDNSLDHESGLHIVHLAEICTEEKRTSFKAQQPNQTSLPAPPATTGITRKRIDLAHGGYYEGDVDSNGTYNGYGLLVDAQGRYCKGNFLHGRLNGQGAMEWPDGQRYEGEFKNGLFHGNGTMRYSNGVIVIGSWQNNNFCDTAAYFD